MGAYCQDKENEMNWRDYLTEVEAEVVGWIEDERAWLAVLNAKYRTISERARKRGARAVAKGEK